MIVWQKSRLPYTQVNNYFIRESFSKDFRLVGQINGSSGSVMDNIAEGFERDGNKEFIQFLYIAKGSNGEVQSQLNRTLDKGFISNE